MSALSYFSIASYNSAMGFGGFVASLEEHSTGLKPLTAAKIITSSVMPRVLALS